MLLERQFEQGQAQMAHSNDTARVTGELAVPSGRAATGVRAQPALRGPIGLGRRLRGAVLRRVHAVADRLGPHGSTGDNTRGKHELHALTIDSSNAASGVHFVSTPWTVLDWVHEAARPDGGGSGWTFLDLGAGKGRAMLSAARHDYAGVVGVEFARELACVARDNLRGDGHEAPRVRLIEGDAAACDLPRGPLLVFMFNPFGPPVLDGVLERLIGHAREEAPVRIAYLNPVHRDRLECMPAMVARPLNRNAALRFRCLSPYDLALYDVDPG